MRALFSILLLCLGIAGGVQAQTPGAPGESGQGQSQPQNPAEEIALFQIRSAFSLTPTMVQVLQKKMADYEAQSGAKPQTGTTGSNSGSNTDASSTPGSVAKTQPQADPVTKIPWSDLLSKSVPMATPFDIRVVGEKIVAIMQIVPLDRDEKGVNLMIQTQLWIKQSDSTVSYRTFVQQMNLPPGARIFYYPLGFNAKDGAPIVVEIRVDVLEKPKKLH
ncbi:MAG: hypothetical protein LLF89_05620 [Spirochaetaceae bacterium]|nr:hypothetical protein [Spirochaetaceae bacterium]